METNNIEISLAGVWKFRMDRDQVGVSEKWFLDDFSEQVSLPGSMEENGFGDVPMGVNLHDLNHSFVYRGWAWYRTDFVLTSEQAGGDITLFLEHIQWDSFVWVDGEYIGHRVSLSAPHTFSLHGLEAGKHVLVILIDNSNRKTDSELPEPNGASEQTSETVPGVDDFGRAMDLHLRSVSNGGRRIPCGIHGDGYSMNGITGEIKLCVHPKVRVKHMDIYPDIHTQTAAVTITVGNDGGCAGECRLSVSCEKAAASEKIVLTGDTEQSFTLTLDFCGNMRLWDEFTPNLYTFTADCTFCEVTDSMTVRCGLRELKCVGRHIFINENRLFLRATLEGCAFPLTAYPPADKAFWARAYGILKSYGLNGMRMHTFIPPKAAFDAAEEAGFYLQIELPGTSCPSSDEPPQVTEFLWNELRETLRLYGNYACFILLSMGNEQLVSGDRDFISRHQKLLTDKVAYCQAHDPRHLYTCTSHNYTDGRNDDVYVVATKDEIVMNGIRWGGPEPITTSRFSLDKPSTETNFEEAVLRMDKPSVTHEVGQWAVYPNFAEMPKYTGVLKPKNYEQFASELDKNGLLGQNADFVKNSGMLSLLLYKEEIESALRTPDLSGFELLDIHDYPGQGTSTVGILDCFFDSKGLIEPEEYRNFCSPLVALCEMDRFVVTSGETMTVTPMVANYSKKTADTTAFLTLTADNGTVMFESRFNLRAASGMLTRVKPVQIPVSCNHAMKAILKFELDNPACRNTWDIWAYPSTAEGDESVNGPAVVTELGGEAERFIREGRDILYLHPYGKELSNGCPGSVTTQFWNPFMKPQKTANGILCDPEHPIFRIFPTYSHTSWQWWEILKQSRFVYLDSLPLDVFPIVQVIPGIKENRKMGLIWECRVENSHILICAADLNDCTGRPAARQLLKSIRDYMRSDAFDPQYRTDMQALRGILR